jgi:subtilase family serine protease
MRKARIAAIAASVAAVTAGALIAATPRVAAHAATGVTVEIRPDAITLSHDRMQAPPTTAQCEQAYHVACYLPGQLRTAYQLPAVYAKGITGKGETIAIVDSFGSPTIKSDLAAFDKQFGYPAPPKFTIITPAGKIPKYDPSDSDMTGWAGETTLDVEYAHALAGLRDRGRHRIPAD